MKLRNVLTALAALAAAVLAVIVALGKAFSDRDKARAEAAAAAVRASAEAKNAANQKAEAERQAALVNKVEEIHAKQDEQRDAVATGDPGADFDGSINVLQQLAKKRPGGGH